VSPSMVGAARRRRYLDAEGRSVAVRFRVQSVLEPFREPDGALVADASVDLVHSSGAIGSHFEPAATSLLVAEARRVLRPGGLALLDAGPAGTSPRALEQLVTEAGFDVCRRARSCILDRYWQYCCRLRA
jgi:SAM-dependent methyltransferase